MKAQMSRAAASTRQYGALPMSSARRFRFLIADWRLQFLSDQLPFDRFVGRELGHLDSLRIHGLAVDLHFQALALGQ
jgi:hypothetical protein